MGKLVINAATREKRAAVIENERVVDLMIEQPHQQRIVGAIYKARVEKVLPGMQAAFVNIGREKMRFYTGMISYPFTVVRRTVKQRSIKAFLTMFIKEQN